MKRIVTALAAVLVLCAAFPAFAQDYIISTSITDFLSAKKYAGAARQYTDADLVVPDRVMSALGELGVSHLTVLRNEMYARHGYIFKTPVLQAIYARVTWYKENPAAGLSALTAMEAKNVNWIKAKEDNYDYQVLSGYMSDRYYAGADKLYYSATSVGEYAPLEIPLKAQLALNHLYINSARLFRSEIFARNGLAIADPVVKRIFTGTPWYKPTTTDEAAVARKLKDREKVNLALLREYEWTEIVDAVKFSLPTGVISIPVIGFNTLFIKDVEVSGETFRFSWPDAWTAMEEKGKGLDAHVTDVNALVDAATIEKIKAEPDPRKKLVLFFSNKKYKGYTDKLQLNHSDMATPDYLQDAVSTLGLDWYLLLRKEIHARNGAKFIDPKVGPIFKACPWYKARFDLTPRTLSRFPAAAAITSQEIRNYSLLEGEELWRRLSAVREYTSAKVACDLMGNFYFVHTGSVDMAENQTLFLGHGFPTFEEYQSGDLQTIIDTLIKSYRFDLDKYREEEGSYAYVGC